VVVRPPAVGAQFRPSWELPRRSSSCRSCRSQLRAWEGGLAKEDNDKAMSWLARLAPRLSSKTSSSLYYDFWNDFNGEHDDTATP
jgi:hypothetical protein